MGEIPDVRLIALGPGNPLGCQYLVAWMLNLKPVGLAEPFAEQRDLSVSESLALAATEEESSRGANMWTVLGSFPVRQAGPTEEREAVALMAH